MKNKLFVGGLTPESTKEELAELFAQFGTFAEGSPIVIMDRETNQCKGFGFVEYSTDEEAAAAIEAMNGFEHNGKRLTVNVARPKEESRPAGGGNFGGGNRGGFGAPRSRY